MTKSIPLSRGLSAIVDDEDFERVSSVNWYVGEGSRKGRSAYLQPLHQFRRAGSYLRTVVSMGRFILSPPDGLQVDHINGDPLDNRRSNLRLCTPTENKRNRRNFANTRSQYKGVDQIKKTGRWRARIQSDGVLKHLGCFGNEVEAALAYDKAATQLHGTFARLNFPLEAA